MPPGGFFAPSILTCLSGKERMFVLQFSELTIYIHVKDFMLTVFFPERRHEKDTKDNQRDAEANMRNMYSVNTVMIADFLH